YSPSAGGGYTIHATLTDKRFSAYTPVEISSHFDFGAAPPPLPPPPPPPPTTTTGNGNAGPNQPGSLDTSDGGAHVAWDGSTFSDSVIVTARRTAAARSRPRRGGPPTTRRSTNSEVSSTSTLPTRRRTPLPPALRTTS